MSEETPTRRSLSLRALAEVVAGVGVLVTLVVLVLEVRANTEATQAASFAQSIDALNEFRLTLAADRELAELWRHYVMEQEADATVLNDVRTQVLRTTLWGIYENAYFAHQRGLLGIAEWSRFERTSCEGYFRDMRHDAWMRGSRLPGSRQSLTDEFADYVESVCLE